MFGKEGVDLEFQDRISVKYLYFTRMETTIAVIRCNYRLNSDTNVTFNLTFI